jgi:Legionella pneumophila major outer membrane protein precursor
MAFCYLVSLDSLSLSVNVQECNNGLPNISARHCPNSRDFSIFANFIVWTAREAGADIWAEVIVSDGLIASNDLLQVNFGWDPGFRVGVGYGMKHDQWDTQVFYTWFNTIGKDATSSGPGTVYSTFLGNFYVDNADGAGLSGPAYQSATIGWTINFNMFDWELGRKYRVSKALSLRPFLGIKGGWIYQSIHSKWQNPDRFGVAFFNVGTENLENNFWGIGPGAGINTQWDLFKGQSQFYLFGNFSGALMYGHWFFSDLFQNDISQQVSVSLQDINSGASMLRTFMGFGCDVNFHRNQCRFSAKLGYEMQLWLDQLQFYSFTGGRLVNVLTLQGGTFEICFDF